MEKKHAFTTSEGGTPATHAAMLAYIKARDADEDLQGSHSSSSNMTLARMSCVGSHRSHTVQVVARFDHNASARFQHLKRGGSRVCLVVFLRCAGQDLQ